MPRNQRIVSELIVQKLQLGSFRALSRIVQSRHNLSSVLMKIVVRKMI